jgi:hypothetical protein
MSDGSRCGLGLLRFLSGEQPVQVLIVLVLVKLVPCVARRLVARSNLTFAGRCWRRSSAVNGSSGASWGHVPNRPSAVAG